MDKLVKALAADGTLLAVGLVDTKTVEDARRIHDTYPTASAALGRALSGAVLLASVLKQNQKVTLQIAGDGPLQEIVAEADSECRVRGYIRRPHVHLDPKNGKLDVGGAVGSGFLNVIKDVGLREPYRGTVNLQSGEIAEDIAYYLNASEQVPSAVSLGVYVDKDNSVKAAGGFMIQALPDVKDETLECLEERLRGIRQVSAMVLGGAGPIDMLEEALGLPLKIIDTREVNYFCPCTRERVLGAVVTLGRKELEKAIKKGEDVEAVCRFCNKKYLVSPKELTELLKGAE